MNIGRQCPGLAILRSRDDHNPLEEAVQRAAVQQRKAADRGRCSDEWALTTATSRAPSALSHRMCFTVYRTAANDRPTSVAYITAQGSVRRSQISAAGNRRAASDTVHGPGFVDTTGAARMSRPPSDHRNEDAEIDFEVAMAPPNTPSMIIRRVRLATKKARPSASSRNTHASCGWAGSSPMNESARNASR